MKSVIPVFEYIFNQNLTSYIVLLPINGEEWTKKSIDF